MGAAMGFVFYDVETTGTNPHFDQILQFAAIHTDAELNEIARIERRCRLIPHIIPSPGALKVTRISMERILDPALPSHYEMMCDIAHTLASWTPAIFLGWNTLDFDEHMLRQALYQCLHSPYLTNTEGSSRCDAMKIAQALQILQPGVLAVPTAANGRLTFKLDQLAPANGFDHGNAHDALADVEATLHICRLIRDRAPDQWSNALRFAQKTSALEFMEDAPAFAITECYFGRPYQFALAKLAIDEQNSSSVIAYDLEVDPAELRDLDNAALAVRLTRKVKPVRRVRANAAPLLHDIYDFDGFYGLAPDDLVARANEVRADQALRARLIAAAEREPAAASPYIEAQIYDAFSGDADRERMRQFHATNWEGRAAIVAMFEDPRLAELGQRLVFYHAPHVLLEASLAEIERSLATRMLGVGMEAAPWLTLAAAEVEIASLMPACTAEEQAIIETLRHHVAQEMARCTALIGA